MLKWFLKGRTLWSSHLERIFFFGLIEREKEHLRSIPFLEGSSVLKDNGAFAESSRYTDQYPERGVGFLQLKGVWSLACAAMLYGYI